MDVIILSVAVPKLQAEERANRKRKRSSDQPQMVGLFAESKSMNVQGVKIPKLRMGGL